MYRWLLVAHGDFRWLVIAAGALAIAGALWSLIHSKPYETRHERLGRAFAISIDIQVALGALLYGVFSPLTTVPAELGIKAPPGSEMHFFSVTHGALMAAALIAVHLSAAVIRRGRDDAARLLRSALCYGATMVILLCGIPWWRPLLRAL